MSQISVTVMNGIVKRFSKQIQRLTLGGIAKDQDWGVRNHQVNDTNSKYGSQIDIQLIITEDLLRSIATHLPSLARISFNECGFDDQAIRYCKLSFHNYHADCAKTLYRFYVLYCTPMSYFQWPLLNARFHSGYRNSILMALGLTRKWRMSNLL